MLGSRHKPDTPHGQAPDSPPWTREGSATGELRSPTPFTTTPDNTMANDRAEAAYTAQHAAALASLQALQSVIEDMPAPDGETRINWGHVGSLVEINEQLGHLLRFAAGN